jgi:hypothetical protein
LDALGYKLNKTTTDLILFYKNEKNNIIFNKKNENNYLKISLINNVVFAESLCQIVRDGNYIENDHNVFQISKKQTILALDQINLLLKGHWLKIRKFIIDITSSSLSNNGDNTDNSKSSSSLKTKIRPKNASNFKKSGSNRQITVDNRQEITGKSSNVNENKDNNLTEEQLNTVNDNRPASWSNTIVQKYLKLLQISYNDISKDKNINKIDMISGKDLLCVTHRSLLVDCDIASSLLQERFILYQKVLKVRFVICIFICIYKCIYVYEIFSLFMIY